MARLLFVVVLGVAVVACYSPTPTASPPTTQTRSPVPIPQSPTPPTPLATTGCGMPCVLYLQNRGGPAFTVRIANADVMTVACNGYPTIPLTRETPSLPWDLAVVRVRDGVTIYATTVTQLPGWFVQIGEEPLGVSYEPVLGPPGPTCPPSG